MTTHHASKPISDQASHLSRQTKSHAMWLFRAPLPVAAGLVCVICGFNLFRLVIAPAPRDPWEATEVLEAWRSLHGMPVYELAPDGHSTHVYGALVPWVQGEIFRWVGPNNVTGRLLSLVSALVVVGLVALTMAGKKSAFSLLLAAAVIFGVNTNRSSQFFAENRPDTTAMLFATGGILMIASGMERRRGWYVALGTACLVTGFFFKQIAFIFAVVPLVALALHRRRPLRSELFLAALPLAVSLGVIFALKIISPTHYYYMITVHRAFGLDLVRAARCLWDLLIDSPLFLVLFGEWMVFDAWSFDREPRVRWLLATLAVTIPFSSVAAGKIGGAPNSLFPAILTMTAFCAFRLPKVIENLKKIDSPRPIRLMQGTFLSLIMLMSTFPHMSRSHGVFVSANPRDREYHEAVTLVGRLPGKVMCPEDPTIPLYAKGYAGQNIFSEYDTHLVNGEWPKVPPATFLTHCRTADYVVDIGEYWQDLLNADLLRSLGFEPAPELAPGLSCYRIWRRTDVGSSSSANRTALNETGQGLSDQNFSR